MPILTSHLLINKVHYKIMIFAIFILCYLNIVINSNYNTFLYFHSVWILRQQHTSYTLYVVVFMLVSPAAGRGGC